MEGEEPANNNFIEWKNFKKFLEAGVSSGSLVKCFIITILYPGVYVYSVKTSRYIFIKSDEKGEESLLLQFIITPKTAPDYFDQYFLRCKDLWHGCNTEKDMENKCKALFYDGKITYRHPNTENVEIDLYYDHNDVYIDSKQVPNYKKEHV